LYKCLAPQLREHPVYEALLRKEFEIGFSLAHPGICEYYSFLDVPGKGRCIELEWVEGDTLAKRLAEGSIDRETSRKILSELCDALDYMHHRQVIHRDLKPENILITDNGNNVKIIDFGFSDSDVHVIGKEPAGTRVYAAPELLERKPVDNRADIYSVGLIMKQLPGISVRVANRCCTPLPENRYASVREVKEAALRRKRLSILPILVTLLILSGLALAYYSSRESRKSQDEADRILEETWEHIQEAGFPTSVSPE